MLTVTPKINYSQTDSSFSNRKGAACSASDFETNKFIKPLAKDSFSRVNFKGYVPSAHNVKVIEDIHRLLRHLVESPLMQRPPRIAIVAHSGPDADAFCSKILFKRMIKEAVGVDADVIMQKPVPKTFKPFYRRGEVRVVQEELGVNANAEAIKKHFGAYDAVFCLDTAEKRLFDKGIYDGIVTPSSNIVKIDHHPVDAERTGEFKYGHLDLTDTSQASTGHLLMQFVDALGIKQAGQKFRRMSNLIAATIHGDTNFLQHADVLASKDMEELAKTSDTQRVAEKLKHREKKHIMAINLLKENTKVAEGDQRVVYSTLDAHGTKLSIEEVRALMGIAADGMLEAKDLNYSIVVGRHPECGVFASIRSQKEGNAFEIAKRLGGCGRLNASRILFPEEISLEDAAAVVLREIELSHSEPQRIAC